MSVDLIQGSRRIIDSFTMLGLWPMAAGTKWYIRYIPKLLHVPLTFSFVALMLLKAIFDAEVSELVDLLYILLTEFGMAVKLFNFFWYNQLVIKTFHEWECNSIYKLHTVAESIWWRRKHRDFVVVNVSFLGLCYFSLLCTVMPDLYYGTMRLPFQLWLPNGWLQLDRYYYYYFSFELVAMSWNCVCNTTFDIYFCYISFHMSLIYRLLESRLQEVGTKHNDDANYDYLVEVIELQQSAERMSKDCERILCYPMLFQIFLSTFVLCFSAYRLQNLEVEEQTVGFFAFPYLISMILQIYLPCYYANEITLSSLRLCTSLYSSEWIECSAKNRRLLLNFMAYLRRPVVLRAGGFFAIGLPLFSKVINNAYSLLALLLNLDN